MTAKVKAKKTPAQRAGRTMTTRLSAKNQITIPVDVLRKAGFKVGDAINCTVDEDGKILLAKPINPMLQFAGIFSGMYDGFDLRADRDAWDE
jgi:bifunctional DNA-binding transcriptional regulator/antitoxin component of YhaV-PrlF toxin-antitoxin module